MSRSLFAFSTTSNQPAHRAQTQLAISLFKSKSFSKPNSRPQPDLESASKTAQLYLFTGSNTPYQSHE